MSYGYAVVEINQASQRAETIVGDLCWSWDDANYTAEAYRTDAAEIGRRERYVVVELIAPEDDA